MFCSHALHSSGKIKATCLERAVPVFERTACITYSRQGGTILHRQYTLCLFFLQEDQPSANFWQLEDAMIPTLIVLLCLGLSLGPRNPVLAGGLSKPTLRAVPSNEVTIGKEVTLLCEGPLDAQEYHFYKEGNPDSQVPTAHEDTEKKDKIFISSIKSHEAGQYWCYYKSPDGTSEHSDPLELVVTGVYTKPTLSALPNPVVTFGTSVTLSCTSNQGYDGFILIKDEQFYRSMDSQYVYTGQSPGPSRNPASGLRQAL
nr:leukocyte immunoglobulin-like receptor subfamily A member 5 [Peromyscus maniculatus bairdii]